jgi:hypothetical protein
LLAEQLGTVTTPTTSTHVILDYLATRSDIDMDRVGMFGVGSGATVAIFAASVDARIKAFELLSRGGIRRTGWPSRVSCRRLSARRICCVLSH